MTLCATHNQGPLPPWIPPAWQVQPWIPAELRERPNFYQLLPRGISALAYGVTAWTGMIPSPPHRYEELAVFVLITRALGLWTSVLIQP